MGHHHAVESSGRKRPGPRLDVRNANLDPADSSERNERRLIAIDSDDGETQGAQIAQMPAMAAGDVENATAALAARGIAVLRFDCTGLGGSEGDFANPNFSSNIGDLVAAADFLRENYRAPAILVGHSLGGTAVLAAAPDIPECTAVATIGSPFEPQHVLRLIGNSTQAIEREGEAQVELAGRSFRIKKQFLDDIRGHRLGEIVARMGKALMVMHSPRDAVIAIDNASKIFTAAKHPKSFVSLDPADHLLSRREDAFYAGQLLAAWAERYVDVKPDEIPATPAGRVLVRETREGKFTNRVFV